jgi:hypothetical protein
VSGKVRPSPDFVTPGLMRISRARASTGLHSNVSTSLATRHAVMKPNAITVDRGVLRLGFDARLRERADLRGRDVRNPHVGKVRCEVQSDAALSGIDGSAAVHALITDDIRERVGEEHPADLRVIPAGPSRRPPLVLLSAARRRATH